jgi:hypothetical protein
MPVELPFEPIKPNSPPGASPPFPSEVRSIQDAKDFVNTYVDVPKRDTLRWRLTIAALGDPGSYTNVQLVLRNALDEEGWLADSRRFRSAIKMAAHGNRRERGRSLSHRRLDSVAIGDY